MYIGVELLGSPWGTEEFLKSFVATQVEKTLELQLLLGDLEDPHVELHLLPSCLGTRPFAENRNPWDCG